MTLDGKQVADAVQSGAERAMKVCRNEGQQSAIGLAVAYILGELGVKECAESINTGLDRLRCGGVNDRPHHRPSSE